MEDGALAYFEQIDRMGGWSRRSSAASAAEIAESSYRFQQAVERKERSSSASTIRTGGRAADRILYIDDAGRRSCQARGARNARDRTA
jgi:hypothetical protein